MSHQRTVYVIDRDLESRRSLSVHLGLTGAEAWPFAGGAEMLAILDHLMPACVLLDVDGSDPHGLEVLRELGERRPGWPVVAVSSRDEVALAVEVMKLGALDFLVKPVGAAALAAAFAPAWAALHRSIEEYKVRGLAQERVARLTAREVDISLALLSGRPNKTVAHDLGISVRTVEMHRAHIMAKLGVRSLAEAAVLATQAGLISSREPPPAEQQPSLPLTPPRRIPGARAGAPPQFLPRRLSRTG
ncbi:MAG TPA: LuxR C-terminal-related transcriptional regulator [Allosphingosinicella sp.]